MRASEQGVVNLAAGQHGVFSVEQAVARGMSVDQVKRRVRAGRWRRLFPGVCVIAGSPETWRQRLKASALWFGSRCVFSHRTAAALWELSPFSDETGPIVIASTRHVSAPSGVRVFRMNALLPRELATVGGLRVTSIERTLLDLAAEEREADVSTALDEALRRKLTTPERLTAFIDRAGGTPGIRVLRRLTERRAGLGGVPESELESRVLELLDEHGMPRPVLQQKVTARGRRYRLDFKFPGTAVVLEADGYAWHSSVDAFERERQRINALTVRGFRVLRWTWAALHDRPDELIAELRSVLSTPLSQAA